MKTKVPELLLVSMNFFSLYLLGGIHLTIIIGLLGAILVFFRHISLSGLKTFSPLLVYLWTIPLLATMSTNLPCDVFKSLFPNVFIVFTIWLLCLNNSLNSRFLLKVYRFLVLGAVLFFFLQELSYFTTGRRPVFYFDLSFLEYYYGGSMSSFAMTNAVSSRSNSFFLEPSHFVQFIFPYFCFLLNEYLGNKKLNKEILLVGVALIMTRSGNAYLQILILMLFVFLSYNGVKKIQKIRVSLLVVGVIIAVFVYMPDNPIVQSITGRMDEFSMDVDQFGRQSGFLRMYRGYYIFGALDPINKLFGVAPDAFDYVSSQIHIAGIRYEGNYVNGVQGLLIRGGIIGAIIFLLTVVVKTFKTSCTTSKYILVGMLTLFFTENMFLDYKMFQYILLIYCYNRYYIENRISKNIKQ